jgi:hypothetical protein
MWRRLLRHYLTKIRSCTIDKKDPPALVLTESFKTLVSPHAKTQLDLSHQAVCLSLNSVQPRHTFIMRVLSLALALFAADIVVEAGVCKPARK